MRATLSSYVTARPWPGSSTFLGRSRIRAHLDRARKTEGRIVLAGRLGPDNVRAAIDTVNPWAVDAASRLEVEPGIKDHDKVRAYVEAAR